MTSRSVPVTRRCGERNGAKLITADGSFDLAQCILGSCADRYGMKPPDKPPLGKDEPPLKLSRSQEALRIIEEYAEQLREIIKKLRRRPH